MKHAAQFIAVMFTFVLIIGMAAPALAAIDPTNFTETFEHAGAIPAGWTFTGSFAIKSTGTGNHTPGGTYSAGVTAGASGSTHTIISDLVDYTGKSGAHLSFWYRCTATSAAATVKVDASIDGGVSYTVSVVPVFTVLADSAFHLISDTGDLSSLAGESDVKFKWTYVRTAGYINIDDITFTADVASESKYDMEINENIENIPSADNYTLQMRYKLANTNDNFRVQVYNGSTWENRGPALTSTSWTDWSYSLLSSEVIGGKVQVRFVDNNPNLTSQDNILIDYLRVRSQAAPWSTSLVMKLRTGDDDNPYDGGWSDWYEQSNGAENTLMENGRYVQYRVELSTTNENQTPVLQSGSVVIYYTGDTTPPSAPSLVSPENGATLYDNTPTFEWTSVTDPSGVTYQIEVDDSDDFSSPVYSAVDLTTTTQTLPDEYALALGKYFWHVRAKDGASNTGEWSGTWDFTVVPMGAIGVLLMPLLMLLPFALMLRRQNRRYHY